MCWKNCLLNGFPLWHNRDPPLERLSTCVNLFIASPISCQQVWLCSYGKSNSGVSLTGKRCWASMRVSECVCAEAICIHYIWLIYCVIPLFVHCVFHFPSLQLAPLKGCRDENESNLISILMNKQHGLEQKTHQLNYCVFLNQVVDCTIITRQYLTRRD